jgi:hypothetical protein
LWLLYLLTTWYGAITNSDEDKNDKELERG